MAAPRRMQKNVQKLIEERDRLRAQLASITERLNGEITGIERAIQMLQSDDDRGATTDPDAKSGRGEAKTRLLDLLREVGTSGLNATIAEQMATQRGLVLKRGTAASNLSRLKNDGVVVHDGEKYRLKQFVDHQGGLALNQATLMNQAPSITIIRRAPVPR